MQQPLEILQDRWKQQQEEVHQAQKRVDELRVKLGIVETDPASTMPTPTLSIELMRQLQSQFVLLKNREVGEVKQLEHLNRLERPQLREAIQTALGQPDAWLSTLLNKLDVAQQMLLVVSKNQKPGSPDYDNAKAQVDELDAKVNKAIDGILIGLENGLEATKARVTELNQRIESANSNDLAMAARSRPYYEAKRELNEKIQFNQILGMKIASEKTDLDLPRNDPVTILENAVPPEQPIAPNRTRSFALICLGIILALAGFLILRAKATLTAIQTA